MAFTVETGANVAGANSYVDVAYADAYHADMGNAAWALLATPAKQTALMKATQYIETKYSGLFKGQRTNTTQPLQWPRAFVIQYEERRNVGQQTFGYTEPYLASNLIPPKLKDAVCEAALKSTTADLNPDLDRGGKVLSVKVGPIEQTFAPGAPAGTLWKLIDGLLGTLLQNRNSVAIVRA